MPVQTKSKKELELEFRESLFSEATSLHLVEPPSVKPLNDTLTENLNQPLLFLKKSPSLSAAFQDFSLDFPNPDLDEIQLLNDHFSALAKYDYNHLFSKISNDFSNPFFPGFLNSLIYLLKKSSSDSSSRSRILNRMFVLISMRFVPAVLAYLEGSILSLATGKQQQDVDSKIQNEIELKILSDLESLFDESFDEDLEVNSDHDSDEQIVAEPVRSSHDHLLELVADSEDNSDFEFEPVDKEDSGNSEGNNGSPDSPIGFSFYNQYGAGLSAKQFAKKKDLSGNERVSQCVGRLRRVISRIEKEGGESFHLLDMDDYGEIGVKDCLRDVFAMCERIGNVRVKDFETCGDRHLTAEVKLFFTQCVRPSFLRLLFRFTTILPIQLIDLANVFVEAVKRDVNLMEVDSTESVVKENGYVDLVLMLVRKLCTVNLQRYPEIRQRFVENILGGFVIPNVIGKVISRSQAPLKKDTKCLNSVDGVEMNSDEPAIFDNDLSVWFDSVLFILQYFAKYYIKQDGHENILLRTGIWRDVVNVLSGCGNVKLSDGHKRQLFAVALMGCARFQELWNYTVRVPSFKHKASSLVVKEEEHNRADQSARTQGLASDVQRIAWSLMALCYARSANSKLIVENNEMPVLSRLNDLFQNSLLSNRQASDLAKSFGSKTRSSGEETLLEFSISSYRSLRDVLFIVGHIESMKEGVKGTEFFPVHPKILKLSEHFYFNMKSSVRTLEGAQKELKPQVCKEDERKTWSSSQLFTILEDMKELDSSILHVLKDLVILESNCKKD